MNPWIILGIILWLGCGFVGKCMMKYAFRSHWDENDEILGISLALFGLIFLIGAVVSIVVNAEESSRWGLKL